MAFFTSAVTTLQTLVVALGAGLAVWGVINLLEGYGSDNPGAKSQGMKHVMDIHYKQIISFKIACYWIFANIYIDEYKQPRCVAYAFNFFASFL